MTLVDLLVKGAVALAKTIAKKTPPPVEVNVMCDLFLQRNMIREATAFLLDVLAENKPEQALLQTKVILCCQHCTPQLAYCCCLALMIDAVKRKC